MGIECTRTLKVIWDLDGVMENFPDLIDTIRAMIKDSSWHLATRIEGGEEFPATLYYRDPRGENDEVPEGKSVLESFFLTPTQSLLDEKGRKKFQGTLVVLESGGMWTRDKIQDTVELFEKWTANINALLKK